MNEKIKIDGKNYVLESSIKTGKREKITDSKFVIARTYSAGVFAGYLKTREGKEVVLNDARRIWYWKGAASLSQLSKEGTNDPSECKFPCAVDEVLLTEVIELLPCTDKAKESIEGVPVWKK